MKIIKKVILKLFGGIIGEHYVHLKQYSSIKKIKSYTGKTVGDLKSTKHKLAVVGGYPLVGYINLGYDNIGPYYNPLKIFKEVHYFQKDIPEKSIYDFTYPFYVHSFSNYTDIVKICKEQKIDIIRGYDYDNGELAMKVAKEINIPSVVSIH